MPISEMGKLKLREVKIPTQGMSRIHNARFHPVLYFNQYLLVLMLLTQLAKKMKRLIMLHCCFAHHLEKKC